MTIKGNVEHPLQISKRVIYTIVVINVYKRFFLFFYKKRVLAFFLFFQRFLFLKNVEQ